jgi:hypothetical protein
MANARRYGAYVMSCGHAPFIPHLLYTQWLDDSKPAERQMGIDAGLAFLEACDEMWIFLPPNGLYTKGMAAEAAAFKGPVHIFKWGLFNWQ